MGIENQKVNEETYNFILLIAMIGKSLPLAVIKTEGVVLPILSKG